MDSTVFALWTGQTPSPPACITWLFPNSRPDERVGYQATPPFPVAGFKERLQFYGGVTGIYIIRADRVKGSSAQPFPGDRVGDPLEQDQLGLIDLNHRLGG